MEGVKMKRSRLESDKDAKGRKQMREINAGRVRTYDYLS